MGPLLLIIAFKHWTVELVVLTKPSLGLSWLHCSLCTDALTFMNIYLERPLESLSSFITWVSGHNNLVCRSVTTLPPGPNLQHNVAVVFWQRQAHGRLGLVQNLQHCLALMFVQNLSHTHTHTQHIISTLMKTVGILTAGTWAKKLKCGNFNGFKSAIQFMH